MASHSPSKTDRPFQETAARSIVAPEDKRLESGTSVQSLTSLHQWYNVLGRHHAVSTDAVLAENSVLTVPIDRETKPLPELFDLPVFEQSAVRAMGAKTRLMSEQRMNGHFVHPHPVLRWLPGLERMRRRF